MRFFSAVALVAALAVGFVDATPTKTIPLVARGGSGGKSSSSSSSTCKQNEFWYETRSCCLPSGGPSAKPSPPRGVDCPSSWYFHYGQNCCVPRRKPTTTSKPTCSKRGWSWLSGLQCCSQGGGSTTSSIPAPSSKPKSKGDKPKVKRNFEQWDLSFCPTGLSTCPIVSNGVFTGDSECVDTTTDLTSCGGCASLGEGTDCSLTPGASCSGGVCVVDA